MSRDFSRFSSRVAVLLADDIDTDQIVPARFLKLTDKAGLADALFADWGSDPSFVLNQPSSDGARVLLAGGNFGCGSSREHAPWALVAHGFRAIIARSFADIFRNNALKNGLLPIALGETDHGRLVQLLGDQPAAEIAIDLEAQLVTLPDGAELEFSVDPFSRDCLCSGRDELGYLLALEPEIGAFEARQRKLDDAHR
jgi:3-isopropylmalate/(R)-2-methylmalate dehydratase small subunit